MASVRAQTLSDIVALEKTALALTRRTLSEVADANVSPAVRFHALTDLSADEFDALLAAASSGTRRVTYIRNPLFHLPGMAAQLTAWLRPHSLPSARRLLLFDRRMSEGEGVQVVALEDFLLNPPVSRRSERNAGRILGRWVQRTPARPVDPAWGHEQALTCRDAAAAAAHALWHEGRTGDDARRPGLTELGFRGDAAELSPDLAILSRILALHEPKSVLVFGDVGNSLAEGLATAHRSLVADGAFVQAATAPEPLRFCVVSRRYGEPATPQPLELPSDPLLPTLAQANLSPGLILLTDPCLFPTLVKALDDDLRTDPTSARVIAVRSADAGFLNASWSRDNHAYARVVNQTEILVDGDWFIFTAGMR